MQLTEVVETAKASNSANKTLVTLFITRKCRSGQDPQVGYGSSTPLSLGGGQSR